MQEINKSHLHSLLAPMWAFSLAKLSSSDLLSSFYTTNVIIRGPCSDHSMKASLRSGTGVFDCVVFLVVPLSSFTLDWL